MYIVECYTPINGKLYRKGDIVPEGLPEEKIKWLLEAGAIKRVAPASPLRESEGAKEKLPPADGQEEMGDFPFPEVLEDPGDGFPEEEGEDLEGDEETLEIDVMAGIVQEEAEEPEKPVRTSKKTAGRRKTK